MTIEEIKLKVASKKYNFLRENEHLGKNIILLGLGGSHAYGTNTETSDLDIRGIATNRNKENTSLPDNPDYNRINDFVISVNERIVKGEL